MASYFDEHDCEPLRDGQTPDHLLHMARLLQDAGMMEEFEEIFGQIQSSPPASKKVVENLPTILITDLDIANGIKCSICLLEYIKSDRPKKLPCEHMFHSSCIIPWLGKTNTCPMCRHELPTDDESYENMKKHKAREAQRKHDLENLHDSMFG